jgi:subtilisin family serine protease
MRLPLAAPAARKTAVFAALALSLFFSSPTFAGQAGKAFGNPHKLDQELAARLATGATWRQTRLIVRLNGKPLPAALERYRRGHLDLIDAWVLEMPDAALSLVALNQDVVDAHFDRGVWATDYLSTRSTGADVVWNSLGYTGLGVGVAVIDSGITSWHDDLVDKVAGYSHAHGNQRVGAFVDFVNGQVLPYDDNGHGSHVAGIILGNGFDAQGKQSGMAPDANLVALKVLDKDGNGTISNVLAALDWVGRNASAFNIKVVNVSVGADVSESYWTDPLTLAVKRLVDQGIVVVAAAGNLGLNAQGHEQYGGILSPANAPWVLTVGASSSQGTTDPADDQVADFSSRGPTRGDYLAKPDLVAPGFGIRSLSVPGSTLYSANSAYLVAGTVSTAYPPYLSLSGTSMAAPQVAGALVLMFQAYPGLTPNLAKGILEYTAQTHAGYNALEQGAGFLNVFGAVSLSKFYNNNQAGSVTPVQASWSMHLLWGNHMISGGSINPLANAWSTKVVWGADGVSTANGSDNIVWGTNGADNIVWGTNGGDNIVWGTNGSDNIVWGTSAGVFSNIVWGTACGGFNCPYVVWGTIGGDNIVWGTNGGDNIVWGTNGGDNIVWGTNGSDNIVWGTNGGDNIVWGTNGSDNIVWGTNGSDNIVWGTAVAQNILWPR